MTNTVKPNTALLMSFAVLTALVSFSTVIATMVQP